MAFECDLYVGQRFSSVEEGKAIYVRFRVVSQCLTGLAAQTGRIDFAFDGGRHSAILTTYGPGQDFEDHLAWHRSSVAGGRSHRDSTDCWVGFSATPFLHHGRTLVAYPNPFSIDVEKATQLLAGVQEVWPEAQLLFGWCET